MTSEVRGRAVQLVAVVLFALAGALAAYAAWSYAEVQLVIRAAVEAGQLASEGSEYDIASFTMSSSGQYLVLAVILAALAWLVLRSGPRAAATAPSDADRGDPRDADDDDPLDDDMSIDEFVNPRRSRDRPA